MTEQQHPITPPRELLTQWRKEAPKYRYSGIAHDVWIAVKAAQWGADQELDACCAEMKKHSGNIWNFDQELRAARRPEPPSLKEQALESVAAIENMSDQYVQFEQDVDTIRRALKSLPE